MRLVNEYNWEMSINTLIHTDKKNIINNNKNADLYVFIK